MAGEPGFTVAPQIERHLFEARYRARLGSGEAVGSQAVSLQCCKAVFCQSRRGSGRAEPATPAR
jgi:hypothetical protein